MIALDAELQERSLQDLKSLAKSLNEACTTAKELSLSQGAKRGAVVSLGGVTLSVEPLLRRQDELERLRVCLPSTAKARKKYAGPHTAQHTATPLVFIPFPRYRLVTPTKAAQWSVDWSAVDDSHLLVGVYEHGVGNWDAIKGDSKLGLGAKVRQSCAAYPVPALHCTSAAPLLSISSSQILLSDRSRKPQASHLQTRVEYLLRLLQKESSRSKQKVRGSVRGAWTSVTCPVGLHRAAARGRPLCRNSLQWPSEASRPLGLPPVVSGVHPGTGPKGPARVRVRTRWTRTSSHRLQGVLVGGPMGGDRGRRLQLLPLESASLGCPSGYGMDPVGKQDGVVRGVSACVL